MLCNLLRITKRAHSFCITHRLFLVRRTYDTREKPARIQGKFLPEKSYKGIDPGKRVQEGPYGSQPEVHAAFAAMVTLIDKQVGELLEN